MAEFYLDHNVAARMVDLLEARGHTATTVDTLGLAAAKDNELLLRAAQDQRIFITHNWKDFLLLHSAWQEWSAAWGVSPQHAGILVIPMPPRWDSERATREIDFFLGVQRAFSNAIINSLHRWTQDRGWSKY